MSEIEASNKLLNHNADVRIEAIKPGKYLTKNSIAYLIIYSDPRFDYSSEFSTKSACVVGKLKNEIVLYELVFLTTNYKDKYIDIINLCSKQLNGWNGWSFNFDYNKNGIDEIGLFELTGMSFGVSLFEFNGVEFKNVLKYPSDSILKLIAYDKNQISFKIIDDNNFSDGIVYSWSKNDNAYLH